MDKFITGEELKKIRKTNEELNRILTDIGILESRKHAALHSLADVNRDNEEYKRYLEEKYGSVNISLEDGSYTLIEKEEK